MSLEKQNELKFTVKKTRRVRNSSHERNRMRGTVIIVSTLLTYLVRNRNLVVYLCRQEEGI